MLKQDELVLLYFFCLHIVTKINCMKKIILPFLFILFCSTIASAQITKGSKLLGGGISFGNSTSETSINKTTQTGATINLSAGVAVKPNLIVGGSVNFGYSDYEVNPTDRQETTNYGGGAFVRKYFPLGKNFYLYGQTDLNISFNEGSQTQGTDFFSESKGWGINLNLAPGVSYALTKKFHLELGFYNLASIGYNHSELDVSTMAGNTKTENSFFGFSSNLGTSTPLNIGFRFLLAK